MDSIADVIAILEREIEHLAGKSPRLGPLQTSLALLYWDLEDDPQRAHETLTENNASYFVARLRHQLLIATEDLEGAINALASHAAVSSSFLGDDAGLLLERITSLRIYWLRDLEGAAETAIRGLEEKGRSDESRERLFRSAFLALANTNDDALITLAESHADTPAWLLRAATRSAWEGLKDGKRAKSLLDRLAPASLQVAPLAFEVAIAIKDDEAQIATLRQTLEVLRKSSDETGFPPEGIAEIARVAQELARLLIDSGDLDAADQLITHVAAWQDTPTESGAGLLTRQFELALRRDVAIQRHDLDSLVEIYGALRDLSASPDIQKAYTARLIELADDVDETLGPHHAPELSTPPKNREDSEKGPPPTLEKPGANTDDALPPQMEGEAPPESSPASPAPTNHDTPMVGDVVAIDDAMLLGEALESRSTAPRVEAAVEEERLGEENIVKIASSDLLVLPDFPPLPLTTPSRPKEGEQTFPPLSSSAPPRDTTAEKVFKIDPNIVPVVEMRFIQKEASQRLPDYYAELAKHDIPHRADLLLRAALTSEAIAEEHRAFELRMRPDFSPQNDPFAEDDLLRLCRTLGEKTKLLELYEGLGDKTSQEASSVYLSHAAALHLERGNSRVAEALARRTLDAQEDNLLARAILAEVLRKDGRITDLRETLDSLIAHAGAESNRGAWLREQANLADTPLRALDLLEQALAIDANDLTTMVSLAAIYELEDRFTDAVGLREKIASRLPDRDAQAAAYIHVGEIYRDRLSDLESAGKAFQAALDRCPDHPTALLRISEIYERLGNDDLLLDVLGHRRELESDPDALSALERDRARCFDRLSRVDETLEALAHSLVLTPGAVPTIELLTHTCRHAQRWEDLAEILAEQPPSEEILQARAEALEQLGQFPALIEVREALFKRSPSVPERADRAYDLGRVYEHHDALDKATQWYQLATEELASHRPALGALSRIYRDAGNLPDLTKVLGEELRWVDDVRDRTDILLELASAKEDLGDPHAAAAHLEEALEIVPDLPLVLDTLEQIYAVDRPVDLANLLRHRAKVEDDKRAAHLLRAAQIFAAHDLREEATVAFRDAILADLSNREIFTAAEAFFYEHELWREVMEIYDILIDACTTEGLRAYRFADLFSRRGQIQVRHLAQPGEAAASFFSALEHDPKSESSLRALTEIFVQQQDWRGLIHAYEFRASLLPDNELFRLESLRQAALLASSRLPPDAPEAQRLWEEIVEIDPADDQGLASLTVIYRSAQDLEKLASVLETRVALESDSNHSLEMLLELARISEVGLDDAERASRAYEKVLALNEHHEEALTALARIYEATARWEPCMDALNGLILIEADPDERSLLYFKCGSIAEARFHSDDKAIHLYKRSLDESAGCMPALHGLRDIYRRQDRWKDALDTLEAELDIWDDDRERAGVLARIGEILLKHLDAPDQADHRFEEALTLDPDCQPALSALFNGAYEKKDASRALAFADRLAPHMVNEGDPDKRADFYLRRGLLLRDHHDVTQAADSLVVALELAPSHIQALDALISLCRIAPDAYDFAAVFRKLEEVYRRDENPTAAAHVSIAAGTLAELAGDADMALDLYRQAQKQAPTAFEPVDTLAHLLVALRRPQEAVTELHAYIDATEEHRERIDALLRLGEIYSEILDQGQAAMNAYEAILSIDMRHREGVFRLAQELYGLNRPQQARQLIDQLLDPELHPNLPVDERARYLHYLGAIQLRLGQTAAAIKNFRRALQQNHLCVEAALALSHQLARNGDRTQAIELLGHTIHEIGSQRGIATTGELRRALGSLFLGAGDLDAAINEYEALARDEEHIDDHVMLAELYARRPQGASRAISVLTEVIVQQTLAPQAFGLLAHLYDTKGEGDRTMQVLQVAELLGLARNAQKNRIEDLRQEFPFVVQRGLDERSRRALVRNKSTGQAIDRLWKVIHPALTQIFPLGVSDRRLAPVEQANAPDFVDAIHDTLNILTSPATALLAPKLPSAVLPDDSDPPRILIDRLWVQTPPTEVRFTVGRALGLQIAGHAILGRLAFHDRQLVVELLAGLLLDPTQRSDLAEEFLRRFDEEHLAQINAISANYQQGLSAGQPPEDPARWIAMVDHSAHIHGLIACDDIGVALRQIAILNGQTLAVSPGGEVAVSAVSGGPALVQYFLGDTYAQLRRRICAS